jgi:cellulose 1,4-beta-cellobiosidase
MLSTALANASIPNHAVVDTSRNAVQGLRRNWSYACNVFGAGFGVRPTNVTGSPYVDAFVWVKNAGFSDGTSDVADETFVDECGVEEG